MKRLLIAGASIILWKVKSNPKSLGTHSNSMQSMEAVGKRCKRYCENRGNGKECMSKGLLRSELGCSIIPQIELYKYKWSQFKNKTWMKRHVKEYSMHWSLNMHALNPVYVSRNLLFCGNLKKKKKTNKLNI